MEKIGHIQIIIKGSIGNLDLSSDSYDIREIIAILENAENLIAPGERKERPVISYKIEAGSVKHIFSTSIQYIIGLNAIIGQINQQQSIDFLDVLTAKAIENIQAIAIKNNYLFTIDTSIEHTSSLMIDRSTRFIRTASIWAEAEFYFYGKITNAGGKDKANIHISTEEFGYLKIDTPITFLEEYDDNLLYKSFGLRAVGKQNAETGEIDKSSLQFLELIDYHPDYDEKYLIGLRRKAKKSWLKDIDPDAWLKKIRGGYDA